jgi:hypothetical protein
MLLGLPGSPQSWIAILQPACFPNRFAFPTAQREVRLAFHLET